MPEPFTRFSLDPDGRTIRRITVERAEVMRRAHRLISAGHTDVRVGVTEADALPLAIWEVGVARVPVRDFKRS